MHVIYQPGDRLWLAALSRLIPRRQWGRDVRGDPNDSPTTRSAGNKCSGDPTREYYEHRVRDAKVQVRELRSYVQEAAGSQSSADQLAKLADLRDRGVITAEEFDREKAKILA